MRRILAWMMGVLLYGMASMAGEPPPDAWRQEAQSAYEEARVLSAAGRYAEAVARGEQALVLREAHLGSTHLEVADCLDLLGRTHQLQGEFIQAEPLLQRGLAIREAALGKSHVSVATSLNNLARLYWRQGLYERAEPLQVRALAIQEAALGENNLDVAESLNNLSALFWKQSLYDRSEALCRRALAIREAVLGKDHPDVAQSLNGLGSLSMYRGLNDQARLYHERALAIREAALGKTHPDVAQSLNNLGNVYANQGAYEQAEPLYERALAIWEAALGEKHPDVAMALANLGRLYREWGAYDRAEPLQARALAIADAVLGKTHPDIAQSLEELALIALARHHLDEAVTLFTRSFTASEKRLRHEGLFFSEERLALFLLNLRNDEAQLHAVLREHPDHEGLRRLALSASLLIKGRSAEETADISRAVYQSLGAQERDTFERLRGLRTQLAQLSLQGPGPLPPTLYQQQLESLVQRGDDLEADLARRSAPLRALAELPSAADIVDRVAQAMPRDAALVEFITSTDRACLPTSGTCTPGSRYLALVLFPDATTRALDLGPVEPIDLAASHLRVALASRDAAFQPQAQALYRLVFQPLLALLGGTHHLFLSPEGQLNLVPFAALHDGHQFLVEAYDFTYLTSGKDLLPRTQEIAPTASVVVLANPDFNVPLPPPDGASPGKASESPQRSPLVERVFSSLREASRSWSLPPLPGTAREAHAIQRLLPQARLFLGAEATKQRLLSLTTPGILHVATHGFFLEDVPRPTASRAVSHFGALGEGPVSSSPNSLLRSGLLLAGASTLTTASSGPTASSPESVLATALELAGLDLWGTQLVILSACDTGRGDVRLGQGVYGLRRAFLVAGAETVVTSLWTVQDRTTSTLMEAYYRHLLEGQGRALALREAMRALRRTHPHPHFWAPFIVLGRDTPLRGFTPAPSDRDRP